MDNEKELQQCQKRLKDLADRSYRQGIFTFTDFLGLPEQDAFWRMEKELHCYGPAPWGGREAADRVMIRFGDPAQLGYETDFPIVCLHLRPLNQKFADDLSHRDFLGALMNLGIERRLLGDIVVGEKQAYLFCMESIADFIISNLTRVKHTDVTCKMAESLPALCEEEPQKELLQVASPRIDAVIAKTYRLSREESLDLFRAGKVFVDGRNCENNARLLKEGETVNARGFGKFRYLGEKGETRKGKINAEVAVYR